MKDKTKEIVICNVTIPEGKKIKKAGQNKDLLLTNMALKMYEILGNENIPFLVHCYLINRNDWKQLWSMAKEKTFRSDVEPEITFENWMKADGFINRKLVLRQDEVWFYYADIYFNYSFLSKVKHPYWTFLYVLTHELLHYIEYITGELILWDAKIEYQYKNPMIHSKCIEFHNKYPDYEEKFLKFMKKTPKNKITGNFKDIYDQDIFHSNEVIIRIKYDQTHILPSN